jgi:hypothetical protein
VGGLAENKILAGDNRKQFHNARFGRIDIEAYAEPFDGAIGFGSEEVEGGYHPRYTISVKAYHLNVLVSMQYGTDRQEDFSVGGAWLLGEGRREGAACSD